MVLNGLKWLEMQFIHNKSYPYYTVKCEAQLNFP